MINMQMLKTAGGSELLLDINRQATTHKAVQRYVAPALHEKKSNEVDVR